MREECHPGVYVIYWDGKDNDGLSASSGCLLYQNAYTKVQKGGYGKVNKISAFKNHTFFQSLFIPFGKCISLFDKY